MNFLQILLMVHLLVSWKKWIKDWVSQTDASLVGSEIGACESISKASWLEDDWVSQSGAFLVGFEIDTCESISGVSWIKGWVLQSHAFLVGFETGA